MSGPYWNSKTQSYDTESSYEVDTAKRELITLIKSASPIAWVKNQDEKSASEWVKCATKLLKSLGVW